jgi:uncharacterized membrane protein YdcZ (DUF606 family)
VTTTLLALAAAVAAGAFIALQAGIIGEFGERVPPLTVAFWVHLAGLAAAFVGVVVTGAEFQFGAVRAAPVGLLAGVLGVGIVSTVAIAVAPLGLGATLAIVTGTQLLLAFLLEASGVLGPVVRFDLARVGGVVLIVLGVLLVYGRGRPA